MWAGEETADVPEVSLTVREKSLEQVLERLLSVAEINFIASYTTGQITYSVDRKSLHQVLTDITAQVGLEWDRCGSIYVLGKQVRRQDLNPEDRWEVFYQHLPREIQEHLDPEFSPRPQHGSRHYLKQFIHSLSAEELQDYQHGLFFEEIVPEHQRLIRSIFQAQWAEIIAQKRRFFEQLSTATFTWDTDDQGRPQSIRVRVPGEGKGIPFLQELRAIFRENQLTEKIPIEIPYRYYRMVWDLMDELASQSGGKFKVSIEGEGPADGSEFPSWPILINVVGSPLEEVLDALCRLGKYHWRNYQGDYNLEPQVIGHPDFHENLSPVQQAMGYLPSPMGEWAQRPWAENERVIFPLYFELGDSFVEFPLEPEQPFQWEDLSPRQQELLRKVVAFEILQELFHQAVRILPADDLMITIQTRQERDKGEEWENWDVSMKRKGHFSQSWGLRKEDTTEP